MSSNPLLTAAARITAVTALLALVQLGAPVAALAHVIGVGDKGYVMCTDGVRIVPFIYLGAKHMVTGVDHLLFLAAVIFFLYRARDVALYVTLFALGHSATLLLGVLAQVRVETHVIDAIIGFSVLFKALDNIGMVKRWLGFQPNLKIATLVFGLCHGLGLATKLLDFNLEGEGVVRNLLAFNVGVEAGQLLALGALLVAISYWRQTERFARHSYAANVAIAAAGVCLMIYQIVGFVSQSA